jgi:SH3-like domain-containing protein
MVKPGQPRPVHAKADPNSRVRYLAEPGVVGQIDHCGSGWCRIAIGNSEGYVRVPDIWGVAPNEVVD